MEQDQEQENNPIDDLSRSRINEDFISKLPDEILAKILSIHPLDSGSKAVAIFTGLWNRPCIKHGRRTLTIQDFECTIGAFLVNFDENNPLKMPRKLEFHFNRGLIVTATLGLNQKLNLDFSKGNQDFAGQFEWQIVLNTMDLPQESPYPFRIKTLRLTSVDNSSFELVSSLITKFRYVESLIIEKCSGLSFLRVEGLAKLVNLSVRDCVDLTSIFIDAFELKSLRYRGFVCWFKFDNVTHLEDVMLGVEYSGFSYLNHRLYVALLRASRDVKVLTVRGWMYKDVFGPWLFSKRNEQHFRFSKLEDLWWIDSSMADHNINSLFSFLKFCPSLKRLFITIDPQSYTPPETPTGDHSSGKVQKWRLRKLKVVRLEGFEDEEDVMFFKERLMEVFHAEPRVLDVRQGMHTRCLIRIPKRKSREKAPESSKLKFCYKFVEEVEDNTGLCSKHLHMA